MVKLHPVSNLPMRRQACAQGWRSHAQITFSSLWSSTVCAVNLSVCDPACDWLSTEAYYAPNDSAAPAADYRLFLLGIGQMMRELP
jgi:hypothetical protein